MIKFDDGAGARLIQARSLSVSAAATWPSKIVRLDPLGCELDAAAALRRLHQELDGADEKHCEGGAFLVADAANVLALRLRLAQAQGVCDMSSSGEFCQRWRRGS